ncbi:MAG: GAF domain-containing protein [Solirubrobacteraceae bacterium]
MEAGDGSRVQESRGRAGEARGASATGGGVSGSDALELARLRARERQLQAVAELGFEALGAPPFAALIDRAVHSVARALAVEIVAIEELLGDGDLVVHAAVGVGEDALGRQHAGAGEGSQAGYTVITGDLLTEARFRPAAVLTRSAARSSVSVAIGSRERPWGVLLAASSRERRFSEDDVVFLHGVANVLAMAWQRADTERTVRVSEELLRGGFEHSPIGMVLANLDGTFNRVNLGLNLPWAAAWLASRAFVAYRRGGGKRTVPLPDFFIGAHAEAADLSLLTRDPARIRTYFPAVDVIAPPN